MISYLTSKLPYISVLNKITFLTVQKLHLNLITEKIFCLQEMYDSISKIIFINKVLSDLNFNFSEHFSFIFQ